MSSPLPPEPVRCVLVTGGTGYLGRILLPALRARGHRLRVLVRPGSETRVPAGIEAVVGNPLAAGDVAKALAGIDTVVHLVGVPHPGPLKARQFRAVDLASIRATADAARAAAPPPHVVYLSVAQPAPVMRAYVAARQEGEHLLRAAALDATCLRPWYVLGPGHRWPYVLIPFYALFRLLPWTRAAAVRLGFVTRPQMTAALVRAVENRPSGMRIVEVPEIVRG